MRSLPTLMVLQQSQHLLHKGAYGLFVQPTDFLYGMDFSGKAGSSHKTALPKQHIGKSREPDNDKQPIRFVLISCSKSKLAAAAPAKELHTGQLFKQAVSWAQRQNLTWFVVSALHGLLPPEQVVSAELTRHVAKHSHAILIIGQQIKWLAEN